MAKYIAMIILGIYSCSLTASMRECNTATSTTCNRAVRYMFDKAFWNIDVRLIEVTVIDCLEELGYKDQCKQGSCPSLQLGYCPFECKWKIKHITSSYFLDDCFAVGNCTVNSTIRGIAATCDRITSNKEDSSTCSTQYCNGNGRCVLTCDYNIACNCSRDYHGKHCSQAVEAKEYDTEKTFTTVQMAVAAGLSSIAGLLMMLAVVCVCRLRSQGKLCFRKQTEHIEDASNSVTMKIIQPSTKEQSDDDNQVRDIDIACDSVPGKSQRDPIYTGSDSDK